MSNPLPMDEDELRDYERLRALGHNLTLAIDATTLVGLYNAARLLAQRSHLLAADPLYQEMLERTNRILEAAIARN